MVSNHRSVSVSLGADGNHARDFTIIAIACDATIMTAGVQWVSVRKYSGPAPGNFAGNRSASCREQVAAKASSSEGLCRGRGGNADEECQRDWEWSEQTSRPQISGLRR